jgi:hypothetical protein
VAKLAVPRVAVVAGVCASLSGSELAEAAAADVLENLECNRAQLRP